MESLKVEIYNHLSKPYVYIVWNKENLLGEVIEDDIMKLLDKDQVIDFFYNKKSNFEIDITLIESLVRKPSYD
tara:strand:+ start:123 stop:341 length:219 start_codon:yes stop_codon:yes gene_type:complete